MMSEVERNIARRLSYWDDVFTKSVGNAGFVEYIWIASGEIADNNIGSKNQ